MITRVREPRNGAHGRPPRGHRFVKVKDRAVCRTPFSPDEVAQSPKPEHREDRIAATVMTEIPGPGADAISIDDLLTMGSCPTGRTLVGTEKWLQA